jgi:hypothetical protein
MKVVPTAVLCRFLREEQNGGDITIHFLVQQSGNERDDQDFPECNVVMIHDSL